MWAGMLAHNNSVGVDREQDWSSHRIGHELSAKYDCAHGASLSVLFPAWMKYTYKHDVARFKRFATVVWGVKTQGRSDEEIALAGIDAMQSFFTSMGMPHTLADVGGCEADIPELARSVVGGKTGRFVELYPPQIEDVLRIAAKG